jgi:hypothetical protein
MDDGGYILRLFIDEIPDDHNREIIFRDEFFYLNVTSKLYVADIAVFWEWEDFSGWEETSVPRGIYEVRSTRQKVGGYFLTLTNGPLAAKRRSTVVARTAEDPIWKGIASSWRS